MVTTCRGSASLSIPQNKIYKTKPTYKQLATNQNAKHQKTTSKDNIKRQHQKTTSKDNIKRQHQKTTSKDNASGTGVGSELWAYDNDLFFDLHKSI
jgi:hypothetical protein